MAQVRWTPQAADDLDAIAEFISRDSAHFAGLFVADVLQIVDQLVDFPQSSRIVPEIGDRSVREIILGNYRIIYRLHSEAVEVLTVHHGRHRNSDTPRKARLRRACGGDLPPWANGIISQS